MSGISATFIALPKTDCHGFFLFSPPTEKMSDYDSVDSDVLQDYAEFSLAALVYGAMKDGAAAEQASRMTAMEGASKNAGKHAADWYACIS